ncbi:MAB_1171c family putative transporter [Nocardia sp. NPDC051570]|uniref:MAB_1171c family putative transporter n=1 Tax=Nocardia sp. NPDC051570 TaxID=3364324 RepID=UPI0037BAD99E
MFVDITREVIFTLVWVVLIVRTPAMIRNTGQRPLWIVLVVIAIGSIAIQSWFATAVNAATGIAKLNNLLMGVIAVVDIAVLLEFVIHMAASNGSSKWKQRISRIAVACLSGAGMSASFAMTPAADRFRPLPGLGPFAVYVIVVGFYVVSASIAIIWILWRHLRYVQGRTLYAALAVIMVGSAAEIPFMIIRTAQRWEPFATPAVMKAAFIMSTTRFVLVPVGCILVVVGPIVENMAYAYRYARLYPMWRLLRDATPDLALISVDSERFTLLVAGNRWEQLHRRVVEIRDSIFYLLDRWAWPELLEEANTCAQGEPNLKRQRLTAIACWLEVTRRKALAGEATLDDRVERNLLPEIVATRSTLRKETRYLLTLHRRLQSRIVRDFADSMDHTHSHR